MRKIGWRSILLSLLLITVPMAAHATGSWATPRNVSESAPDTTGGAFAVDGLGRVLFVWSEGGDIRYRSLEGDSWSAASMLSVGTAPALAADGEGVIHLAFLAPVNHDHAVYYAAWEAGAGWTTPEAIVEHAASPGEPAIAASSDGQAAVVWSEHGEATVVYAARSDDGAVWSVAPVPNAAGTSPAAVYDAQGDLYVAWEEPIIEGLPLEIWVNILEEESWVGAEDVSIAFDVDSTAPALALGPGGVYVAWEEDVEDGPAILLSMQDGVGWELPQVRSDQHPAHTPKIAFDTAGKGHLVWISDSGLWHRTWSPTGGAWQEGELVVGGQRMLSLAGLCANSMAHVGWLAEATEESRDLFYSDRPVLVTGDGLVYLPLVLSP